MCNISCCKGSEASLGQNFSGSTWLEHIFIGMDPPNHFRFRSRTCTEKPLTLQEGKGLLIVMPLSGSELKFEPELFRTGPKFGSKFRQLLDRTKSPVRRSSRRVKCRTCSNSVRTEPYKIPSMKDNQQNLSKIDMTLHQHKHAVSASFHSICFAVTCMLGTPLFMGTGLSSVF